MLTSFYQQAHVASLSVCSLTPQNVFSCSHKRCQENEIPLLSPEGSFPSPHLRNQPYSLPTLKPETEFPKLTGYHPHPLFLCRLVLMTGLEIMFFWLATQVPQFFSSQNA